jgi:uncharacterized protein YdeI (YjbR/CyaY-like superfamily)
MKPLFFRTPAEWRAWLEQHHASEKEVWVGYWKRETGRPSLTWPESVDEALCFGWIDGLRKSIDASRYRIRFTPRKSSSIWSRVNIARAEALIAEGRMRPAGAAAFAARQENRSGVYSFEQRRPELEEPYASTLKGNAAAWDFFQRQPPSYRKAAGWWVVSAKQESTRLRRLKTLIEDSAAGLRIASMRPAKAPTVGRATPAKPAAARRSARTRVRARARAPTRR